MKFYTQFDPKPKDAEKFPLPSETIPDESMSIPEIIARFVRTGSMSVAVHTDIGNNEAFDPDFDPLDFQPKELVSELQNSAKSAKYVQETQVSEASAEPDKEKAE